MMAAVFNALLLMLWLRIVPVPADEAVGNPLVAMPLNRADRFADLLRPAFGPRATRAFAAFVILAFLVTARGFAVQAAGGGMSLQAGPAVFIPNRQSGAACVLFSALSFAWMIQRLWLVTATFRLFRRRREFTQSDGLAESLAEPLSRLSPAVRLLSAALLAAVLSAATIRIGVSLPVAESLARLQEQAQPTAFPQKALEVAAAVFPDFRSATPAAIALMTVGSLADVVSTASTLVFAGLVVQIVGMVLRWPYGVALGASGLEYVVGTFFPRPMRLAGMNFSPLVFLVVAGVVYMVVYNVAVGATLVLTGRITAATVHAMMEAVQP